MSGEELLALLGIDSEIRRRKNRFGHYLSNLNSNVIDVFVRQRRMMPHRQNGADDGDEFIGRDSGKSRVLVLDVRPAEEFRLGALPDSVNVPGGGQEGLARIGPDLSTMKKGKVSNQHLNKYISSKVLSNTIEMNFQILSTKYAKFQPNIQIFEYSISCLVTYINNYFDTNKPK